MSELYGCVYVCVAYLREGAIVPQISFVREAVAHISELALLGILLYGVKELFLGDLWKVSWLAYREIISTARG